MKAKDRARRHAMAVAHARRQDNRLAADTGVWASERRGAERALRRERRGCERALATIVRGLTP